MAVTDYKYPGTAANVANGGYTTWSNVDNIKADDSYTAIICTSGAEDKNPTDYLTATNFGFTSTDIPSGATINGIEFVINRAGSEADSQYDYQLYMLKAGTQHGDNLASATKWPTSLTDATYGGATSLLGGTWAQTDIVGVSTFGFQLAIKNHIRSGSGEFTGVEHVKLRVYYTESGGGSSYEKACSVGMNFTPSDSEIANFPASASVWMNLSASDSEIAEFIRVSLVSMNFSASDVESADFAKAVTAAISIASVLGGTTANIYNVAATVAMTLGVSTSEVADFIAVAQIALGLGINDGEIGDINRSASLGMLLSVGNSEVAAFNIEAAEGISLEALASEIGAYIETLSAEFTLTQDVQATIDAAEEFLKSLTAVLNISVSASASVPIAGGISVSASTGFTMAVLAAASLLYSVSTVTYTAGDLKVSLVFNNSSIKYVN